MLPPRPDPASLAQLLASTDYFRRSPSRMGGRAEHKEWQHFIVHTEGLNLLVNFSLVDEAGAAASRPAEVARLIVLAHGAQGWTGDLERFEEAEVRVVAGEPHARFGRNTLRFEHGRWHLSVALRERPISFELEFVPITQPALSTHRPLAPRRPISWLFVPRLEAHGSITLGGRTWRLEGAPAYHDHNWGHFRWSDDFCWEWGSAVPLEPDNPWSVVLVRMADRGRTVARYQALFLWGGGESLRVFRDEELSFSTSGRFQPPHPFCLPRPMALLAPGMAADLPGTLEVRAQGRGDELRLTFAPRHAARLMLPDEASLEHVTSLHEVLGPVSMHGRVLGETVAMEGPGVFEFVRG
ncbi:hypothetical protein [Stigmatella aurantiaca]|uniref:Conserved uncharacterized protein n=1 Tax=Stigmatella aurantiaca (strain DW4/3-1) TaxID=378806 RepID=Q090W8_STIAD|nr:hypothetical protein [Stigmatella aurantiaca]ADO75700.1 conserved uncharacterized protein [Stigmatella aurantiaca DW4/3-1]EAU66254.1 conserved hypothetical protein [Stigmatella aurantiaca DW4/3-1]